MCMKNEKYNRKSIRLKGYDYSKPGLYFITICTKNHTCLFGEIFNGKIKLNDAGKMVEKWYYKIMGKFNNIKCRTMVIMPDHFHCIIEIKKIGEPVCLPLHTIVQWFKTMTTNEYIRGVKNENWKPFNKKLWQRNYYERIIRDKKSYEMISEYIVKNPMFWRN